MLTYADACWRVLTYADASWRKLTYADVCEMAVKGKGEEAFDLMSAAAGMLKAS